MTIDVAVIGAGISGLASAYALTRAGLRVIVLEATRRTGGRIASERITGFLMEHGPNGIVAPAPASERLITELALAGERVERSDAARNRYVMRARRMHALSLQPWHLLFRGPLSFAGRLRLLAEPLVAPRPEDETVAAFARRRFGGEFLDYVMEPLAGGLYAGSAGQLSIAAVFPQLKRLERRFGSVTGASLMSRFRRIPGAIPAEAAARTMFSFRGGMRVLADTVAQRLAGLVFLGQRVESVQRRGGGGFRLLVRDGHAGRSLGAECVVVASPAYAAAPMLERLDRRVAQALALIRHPPVAVVFLGYRAGAIAHPLDGAGVLLPAVERRDVLGILFSSTLFPGRAPSGHVALTAFVGGARQPQLAALRPAELTELVAGEVRRMFGARAAPMVAHTHCWRRALPQPGLEHPQRIRAIAALENEHPGLFLTGNYLGGVSTAACIEKAADTARRVEHHLAARCLPSRRVA
ncbi:MAG: protoporphyrinogen oxidase [Acidobacteria bacterium RIFCSPLOWO2_02_FULL_65_29]|nr:MAG: protoporphyrinogen oxidase [Acidobacteria bacterium RIFCSPLOWO2_02_FULL_65_29]